MTERPTADAVEEVLAHGEHLRRRYLLSLVGLTVALLLVATLGMSIGAVQVPFDQVWTIIGRHLTGRPTPPGLGPDAVIWQIRFPRVLMGAAIGAELAVVGVAIQAMVRNPLADPYVLGVQSGASVGAVLVIYFGAGVFATGVVTPAIGAFVGAVVTLFGVFALARQGGRVSSLRLLLVGVALSYALDGLTSFFLYATRDPAAQNAILFWVLGSLGGTTWPKMPIVLGSLAIGLLVIGYHARQLNALAVGDESAASLGTDPDRLRSRLFVVCSLVIAGLVSVAGPIGFVGLVVPHVGRLLVGAEHRRLVPVSVLLGGTYLVGVDLFARTIFSPSEIPIGVVTAILGTPFFLWLLRRRGSSVLQGAGS